MNTVAKIRQSYPRIESECGFGNCAGHHACRDKHCPEHPNKTGMLGLPVIDEQYLDEQLYQKDAKSFGGLDHLPIEMIEPIPSVMRDAYALKTIALGGFLLAVIVGVLYVSTL
jgi:hypothetical protein